MQESVWIGLVEAKPMLGEDPFDGALGAYVNTLAWAFSIEDYTAQVIRSVRRLGAEVVAIEDVERLAERAARFEVEDGLLELGRCVEEGRHVAFGTWHSYRCEMDLA